MNMGIENEAATTSQDSQQSQPAKHRIDQLVGEDANSSDSEYYELTSYLQPPAQVPLSERNEAKKIWKGNQTKILPQSQQR